VRKKPENHLLGMWRHPVGGWEICYKKDGKKFSEYRREEAEAKLRAEYWKATLESPPGESWSEEDHPVRYWERKLREIAELALSNPTDKQIADTCKAIAAAATAALRTAKYIPAPGIAASPDSAPIQGDITSLTSEQLERLNGNHDVADKEDEADGQELPH
jgi:hypothetical protein